MLIVLYDDKCPICQKAKKWLESIDKTGSICFQGLHGKWVSHNLTHIPQDQLQEQLHVITYEGQIYSGAAAYREIAEVVPVTSFGSMLLKLYGKISKIPLILNLSQWLYLVIAKNRNSCSLKYNNNQNVD